MTRLDKVAGRKVRRGWFWLCRGFKGLCAVVILCVGVLLVGRFQCCGKEAKPQKYLIEQSSQELQSSRELKRDKGLQSNKELKSNKELQNVRELQNDSRLQKMTDRRFDYVNPETGYQVLVEDWAELLTDEQLNGLAEMMQGITVYGNAAFVTTDRNASSTENFAREYYMDRFGTDSGTVFVIDMEQRNIWIHSDGAVWKVVTTANANTVADNVYRYASRGDYYGCAAEAFKEIHALLEGERIARPMKYIGNALLAMILALLANYGLVFCFAGLRQPPKGTLLASINRRFRYSGLKATYTHQTKVYDPVSSGSSGGSSGGSGGSRGGGSGGSRSGGGGGHKF